MSLFFCNPQNFKNVCEKICNSIIVDGVFVGNFLGKEDEWNKNEFRTFVDERDLKKIFKNFEMLYFNEKKFNKQTAKGKMKLWHVYEVIAKKIKD